MKLVKAVVRPEKLSEVLAKLNEEGFPAATRMPILGRGKQQGLRAGNVQYDEIPKEMLFIVVSDADEAKVINIISEVAKTGKKGAYGDGKIFVLPVEKCITISSGDVER